MLSVAGNLTSFTVWCEDPSPVRLVNQLNIPPKDLTPASALFAADAFLTSVRRSLAHVLVDHGLPDALVASFHAVSPQRSSALHCACLSGLCLAVLMSAHPARFMKRPCARLVNLVFITVFAES